MVIEFKKKDKYYATSKNSTFYEILSYDKRAFAWFAFGYVCKLPFVKLFNLSCLYEINCLTLQIEISSEIINIVYLSCLKQKENKSFRTKD